MDEPNIEYLNLSSPDSYYEPEYRDEFIGE